MSTYTNLYHNKQWVYVHVQKCSVGTYMYNWWYITGGVFYCALNHIAIVIRIPAMRSNKFILEPSVSVRVYMST